MLVLSRRLQEKIRIGDNVTITVLRMKGKSVRLGIEAPNHVSVLRGELAVDGTPRASVEEAITDNREVDVSLDSKRELSSVSGANPGETSTRITECCWQSDTPLDRSALPPGSAPFEPGAASGDGVLMMRVPPFSIGQVIAQLAQSAGPLRPMLDRREHAPRGKSSVE